MELHSRMSKEIVLKNRFFNIARNMMLHSDHQTRVGACLAITKNKIIAASNGYKTHTVNKQYPHYCNGTHAECEVVCSYNSFRFGELSSKAVLYVYREDRNGIMKSAKPCSICQKIIRQCDVRKVFYSLDDGYGVMVINNDD